MIKNHRIQNLTWGVEYKSRHLFFELWVEANQHEMEREVEDCYLSHELVQKLIPRVGHENSSLPMPLPQAFFVYLCVYILVTPPCYQHYYFCYQIDTMELEQE